ncbi:PilZ domain-containing protein [Jannaschia sp. Os4]|uniref:PilZ domain-containing protein n=1 Tax=Jannaschia sp. Os4 TaxID=2807617 RepID=UPI0019398DC3|nr:PilZ domain-containing protein [Jannaschia sp. Os4]MBM2576435.1 PilZ domain-containing protein [Jannaschia sp. Os4]
MSRPLVHRARRYPACRPVSVRVEGAEGDAHLMDVSEGGAKLIVDGVRAGEWIELSVGRLHLRGTVRWTADGFAGVRFDATLGPAALADILGRPPPRGAARRASRWLPP